MNAEEVKDSLRRRYPALAVGNMVGEWTCMEELWNIDLLAMSAWSRGKFIGHEVKVSRGDYKSELYKPHKRVNAMKKCDQFFFCTPKGLLKEEELAFEEPEDWTDADYKRVKCPDHCQSPATANYYRKKDEHVKGYGRWATQAEMRELEKDTTDLYNPKWWVLCVTCEGKGHMGKCRVELEAPMLWVPKDVGLIEVTEDKSFVVKKSPTNYSPVRTFTKYEFANAMRWASYRPDKRHVR